MADYDIDLGYKPRDWQRHVHINRKDRNVLIVHRRAGKSVLAVMELVDCALRCTKPNGRFGYIAPFRSQAKDLAWTYIKEAATRIPHTTVSETELWVEFPNKARIRCYGSDNAAAMRGIYFDGAVLDEMADVDPEFVGQVLMPTLADRNGWLIQMGTPHGADGLSLAYNQHKDDPNWFCIKLDVNQTKALNEDQLRVLRSGMSESEWEQEMMCNLEAGTPDVLLTGVDVETAMMRKLQATSYSAASVVLGVDVARFGNDRTVITRRQGLQMFPPIVLRGANTIEVARVLMREIDDHHPDAVFVDGTGGFGGGVVDYCRQFGYSVQEVHFNAKPLDQRFKNARAEMWFGMATWIKNGGALPPDPDYRIELTAPRYKHDDSGKLQLEAKDDVKGRGMPSPDKADSLALTFYAPVMPSRNRFGGTTYTSRTKDDDPKAFWN